MKTSRGMNHTANRIIAYHTDFTLQVGSSFRKCIPKKVMSLHHMTEVMFLTLP
jgi:hypothetical protein